MAENEPDFERYLQTLLDTMSLYTDAVKAISLVSREGLPIAVVVRDGEDLNENLYANMTASAYAMGDRVNIELVHGDFERVIVQGKRGIFLIAQCGPGVLTIIFDKFRNLPQLIYRDIRFIDEIRNQLAALLVAED